MLLEKLYKLQNKNQMKLFFSIYPIKCPIHRVKQKMEVKNLYKKLLSLQ